LNPRDRAASIKQRLLNARPASEDFNTTLTRYAGARLLYRLSVSPHRERFVLKGAVLFSLWSGSPHPRRAATRQRGCAPAVRSQLEPPDRTFLLCGEPDISNLG
jgi:hypothetical protein